MSEPIIINQATCKIQEYKKPACYSPMAQECKGRKYQTKTNIVTSTNVLVQKGFAMSTEEQTVAIALAAICREKIKSPAGATVFAADVKKIYSVDPK